MFQIIQNVIKKQPQNVWKVYLIYLSQNLLVFSFDYSYKFKIIGVMSSSNINYSLNLVDITSDKIAIQQEINFNTSFDGLRNQLVRRALPQANKEYFLSKDVPIYKIQSKTDKLVVSCREGRVSSFLAHGQLIGKFYQSNSLKSLSNVTFVGEFEGMFQWPDSQEHLSFVFFQGKIRNMQLVTHQNQIFTDQDINLVSEYQSNFHGYFKGRFYPWSAVGDIDNILPERLTFRNSTDVNDLKMIPKQNCNQTARGKVFLTKQKTEYILPVLVRFQIKNFGDIDLDKSSAIVNGHLYIQVRYNNAIDELIQKQINTLKHKKIEDPLLIHLNFNRDITLKLPLQQEEDESEDSDWSIQDKTWDIEFTKDTIHKVYRYRILKRFRGQIDNSYGAFFAPFNLSRIKIVVSLAPLQLLYSQEKQKVKISFSCTDTYESSDKGPYDPFTAFDDLRNEGQPQNQPTSRQVNRYHKINRHWSADSGQYIIADNFLTIYPHYKVILLNKSFINEDTLWNLGLRDQLYLFQPPLAKEIFTAFHGMRQLKEANQQINFLRWNHAIIEIPIYKYIVIDMIKIFVPLTIISIISLFIFKQENGIGTNSKFTTLAYRLVNIAAIALVYVSMIPIIRSSLPSMPGITFIQIITYLQTLPSLLAIVNSLLYYNITLDNWHQTFRIFGDWLFLIGFVISLFNLIAVLIVFITYKRMRYRCKWKIDQYDTQLVRWRSPNYVKFMDSMRIHKKSYYEVTQQI